MYILYRCTRYVSSVSEDCVSAVQETGYDGARHMAVYSKCTPVYHME